MRSTPSASPANFSASAPCATRYFACPRSIRSAMSAWPERRHRRDQHEAELHRRQHRRPQFGNDAEHHQETIAALRAERAQAVGEPRRFARKLGEGPRLDALADHLERDLPPMLSGRELGVEPFERPVERMRARPGEGGARAIIVVAEFEQTVARLAERQRLGSGARGGEGGEETCGHCDFGLTEGQCAEGRRATASGRFRLNQRANSWRTNKSQ